MEPLEAYVALNMLPRLGPVRLRALMESLGDPQCVLEAPRPRLLGVQGVGPEVADIIVRWREFADPGKELRQCEKLGVRTLTATDPEYPGALREIHDPPIVLYIRGRLEKRDANAIGVVGTRKPSYYGQETTKRLSYQLAYSGYTVFSGLARGVDTLAHTAALAAKGRTVAVLGSGIDTLYPPENRELAERIAAQGAVLSEFPLSTQPDRQTFPMRNRIVSGCSKGVLVTECAENSGALITANQALEQGRSVYAVPGPVDRPGSRGCNRLIQQGAKLVQDAADVVDDFQLLPLATPPPDSPPPPHGTLNNEQRRVYDALGDDESPIDAIIAKSGLPSRTVSSTLLTLEMKRLVKQLPGTRFVRTS